MAAGGQPVAADGHALDDGRRAVAVLERGHRASVSQARARCRDLQSIGRGSPLFQQLRPATVRTHRVCQSLSMTVLRTGGHHRESEMRCAKLR